MNGGVPLRRIASEKIFILKETTTDDYKWFYKWSARLTPFMLVSANEKYPRRHVVDRGLARSPKETMMTSLIRPGFSLGFYADP